MHEISIKLWRNHLEQDWSAEINGKRYEYVAIELIEELVERALLRAEESLTQLVTRRAQ
jgi:hypothetical protein